MKPFYKGKAGSLTAPSVFEALAPAIPFVAALALAVAVFLAPPGFAQNPPEAGAGAEAGTSAAPLSPPAGKKPVTEPGKKQSAEAPAQARAQADTKAVKTVLQKKKADRGKERKAAQGKQEKQASGGKKPSPAGQTGLLHKKPASAASSGKQASDEKKPPISPAVIKQDTDKKESGEGKAAAAPPASPLESSKTNSRTAVAPAAAEKTPEGGAAANKTSETAADSPAPRQKPAAPASAASSPVLEWAASLDPIAEIGLEYPLSVGVHVRFYFNDQFYTRIGSGFTSGLLTSGFSRIAPAFDYLSRDEARLIGDVIKNSFFGSFRFGWTPKKAAGPYAEIGLMALAWGKGETSGSILNGAVETALNESGKNRYSVRSNLLNGSFYAGYQIPIEKHIHLNIEAGVLKIIAVEWKGSNGSAAADPLPEESVEDFTNFLLKKGWIVPTVAVWLGFSF